MQLFDPEEGIRRRDEALVTVLANMEWKDLAEDAVTWCARMRPTFTTDDVWKRMMQVDPEATVSEPRGLGAVMARNDSIIPTGQYVPSERPECHRRPVRVWRRK